MPRPRWSQLALLWLACAARAAALGPATTRLAARRPALGRAAQHLPRRAFPLQSSVTDDEDDQEPMAITIAFVARPLGLVLTERGGGGVAVTAMDAKGNAVSEDVAVNDVLIMIGRTRCDASTFDQVAELIGALPDGPVELTLGRPLESVLVEFPSGVKVAAPRGAPLRAVAQQAKHAVPYSCETGICSTCTQLLVFDGDGEKRSSRFCVARVPDEPARINVLGPRKP